MFGFPPKSKKKNQNANLGDRFNPGDLVLTGEKPNHRRHIGRLAAAAANLNVHAAVGVERQRCGTPA